MAIGSEPGSEIKVGTENPAIRLLRKKISRSAVLKTRRDGLQCKKKDQEASKIEKFIEV